MQTKKSEIWVGAFMLIALCAIVFICLQVANLKSIGSEPTYRIYATFDNIGGLKPRSPVKIGGVVIGRVADIELDSKTYTPRVALDIQKKYDQIPDTSSLNSMFDILIPVGLAESTERVKEQHRKIRNKAA